MKKHLLSIIILGVTTSFFVSQCTSNPFSNSSGSDNEADSYTITLSIDSSNATITHGSGSTKNNPVTVTFKTAFDTDMTFGHHGDYDDHVYNHEEAENSHHHEIDDSEDGHHHTIESSDDIHHFHDTFEDFQHHHGDGDVYDHNPAGVEQGHYHMNMPSDSSHHHDYTYIGTHDLSGMTFILEALTVVSDEENGEGTLVSQEENMMQILLSVEGESVNDEVFNGFVYTVSIRNNDSGDITEKVLTPAYGLNGIHHITDIVLPQSHGHESDSHGMMGGNHHH